MGNAVDSLIEKQFYSNACFVCRVWDKNVKLKRCANCQMIAYCGREHQMEHWPYHKELCGIISQLERSNNGLYHSLGSTQESWAAARSDSVHLLRVIMGRGLYRSEIEMVTHPRCCEICHETDHNRLRDCGECPAASFCIKHPKDSRHSVRCKILQICFEMNNTSPNVLFSITDDLIKIPRLFFGESIPKNMDEAIDFITPYCPLDDNNPSKKLWLGLAAEFLSRPYTCMYSIQKLSCPKLTKMKIHVIGVNEERITSLKFWEHVLHYNEALTELQILFSKSGLWEGVVNLALCDKCVKENRKIEIVTTEDVYPKLFASQDFINPDYVIGFNSPIHPSAATNDTWPPTIKILAKIGCPFLLTSRTLQILEGHGNWIDSIVGKKVKPFWMGENPFPSRLPMRDVFSDELYHDNQYLAIYKAIS